MQNALSTPSLTICVPVGQLSKRMVIFWRLISRFSWKKRFFWSILDFPNIIRQPFRDRNVNKISWPASLRYRGIEGMKITMILHFNYLLEIPPCFIISNNMVVFKLLHPLFSILYQLKISSKTEVIYQLRSIFLLRHEIVQFMKTNLLRPIKTL